MKNRECNLSKAASDKLDRLMPCMKCNSISYGCHLDCVAYKKWVVKSKKVQKKAYRYR